MIRSKIAIANIFRRIADKIYAGAGEVNDIEVKDVRKFEKGLLESIDTHHKEIYEKLKSGKLTDEVKKEIEDAVNEYKKEFLA